MQEHACAQPFVLGGTACRILKVAFVQSAKKSGLFSKEVTFGLGTFLCTRPESEYACSLPE